LPSYGQEDEKDLEVVTSYLRLGEGAIARLYFDISRFVLNKLL
jgi:hypothetical protein